MLVNFSIIKKQICGVVNLNMHFYLEWDQKRIRVFSIWKLLFRTISEKSIPEFMSMYLLENTFIFLFSFLATLHG